MLERKALLTTTKLDKDHLNASWLDRYRVILLGQVKLDQSEFYQDVHERMIQQYSNPLPENTCIHRSRQGSPGR